MKIFRDLDDRAFETRAHIALYVTTIVGGIVAAARYVYRRLKCL